MITVKFTEPTREERQFILDEYGAKYDRRIREAECKQISGLSRSRRWVLEEEGKFPRRIPMGKNSVSWLLSDVLWWARNPPEVKNVNNPYSRQSH